MRNFRIFLDAVINWKEKDSITIGVQYMSHEVYRDHISLDDIDLIRYELQMFDNKENICNYRITIDVQRPADHPKLLRHIHAEQYTKILIRIYNNLQFKEHDEDTIEQLFQLLLI